MSAARVAPSRPARAACDASWIGTLDATRTAVSASGSATFGDSIPGGGQCTARNRRYQYVPRRRPKSIASLAQKIAIAHQPFG